MSKYDKEQIEAILEKMTEMELKYPGYEIIWDGNYQVKAIKEEAIDVEELTPF